MERVRVATAGVGKSSKRKRSLKEYGRKRDFRRTTEPKPGRRSQATGSQFVVQKHAARRLHYDLRLELDGVLKSWAVTKGPSLTVGEKRLAVRTEDHPIEYLDFEGNIPPGEYGGGAMIVWDRGRWEPEGDPHQGLAKGHLAFSLDGARLKGRWHLVRMRPRTGEKRENWLLIKSEDTFSRHAGDPEITEEATTSYVSGLTTEELAAAGQLRADHVARAKTASKRKITLPDFADVREARKGLLPTFLAPSLAQLCDTAPRGQNWVHEIKYDGYRMQARIDGAKIGLLTRTKLDWSNRFRNVANALKSVGLSSALLDGEIIVEDVNGIPSFNQLQDDLKLGRQDRFIYYIFDLLYAEGFDLTQVSLLERKNLLERVLSGLPGGSPIRFSEHLALDGPTMFEHACRLGLEGIVSKRKDLPYRPGRGDHWLKRPCVQRQDFVILGYVPSTVAKGSVGALLLGYHDRQGRLTYAGRVGTGYSAEQAQSLLKDLEGMNSARPDLANALPAGAEKGVRWAQPQLVCEVQFRGWTQDRLLRGASFKGLREDFAAEEVVLEVSQKPDKSPHPADLAGIRLTHPERILWQEPGVTKQALAEFYVDIADWVVPHLVDRALSLVRCPSGDMAKCFFVKHAWNGLPDSVHQIEIAADQEPMLVINDLKGLIGLVQASVVEIHPWGSTIQKAEQPDRLIFDLDPADNVPWAAVIEAATEVRDRLARAKLRSFVKTSGGKGLHVVVPILPDASWEEARAFTGALAQAMAKEHPDRYVATMTKRARSGRVFIDYFRNYRGATAVAAYSTRARPAATVSTPLAWHELSDSIRADHFTVDNLRQRLDVLAEDPWSGFFKLRQRLPRQS